jgi:CHAT domain-containing protein
VHLATGQLDRGWDECVRLSAPALGPLNRAKGLYCQARVLLDRSSELPSDADRSRIEQAAWQAIGQAAAAGADAASVAVRARWLLMTLARGENEAAAELPGCLAAAAEDLDKRLCLRALARRMAAAGRAPPPEIEQALSAYAVDDPVTRAQEACDRMRISWATHPFGVFLADARRALAEIEGLRARQTAAEVRMGVFSTWSEDYYWFAGRLLEAANQRHCSSCVDAAFDAVERLRARGLEEILAATRPGPPEAAPDPARLPALALARQHLLERQGDGSLPPGERDHAAHDAHDLAQLAAAEERIRRQGGGAGRRREGATETAAPPAGIATLATVQHLLRADEALLSFQIAPWTNWSGDFGGGSWLVVATRGARRGYRLDELGRGALRQEVADLLQTQQESDRLRLAATLYRQLLGPALRDLAAGIQRLIVVPDDDLHRLPFAALRPDRLARPLVFSYEIEIAPSATLWARWRAEPPAPPAARPALILADPPPPTPAVQRAFLAAGIELPAADLPGTRREAAAALRYLGWGCERRFGSEVTPAALSQPADRLRRFALVHFATHSIVDDRDPRRSGIWLGPAPGFAGLLQAPAIAQLRCDGRLVVLSTCSGNGGPLLHGEGVMSLAHAFFQARARTVVASLAPLGDDDAALLLKGFYRHLGEGAAVAAALRLAQIERLQEDPRAPIAAWAGLVVLGDGSLVPFPGGRRPWAPVWAAGGATALLAATLLAVGARRHLRRAQRRKHRAA